MSKVRYPYGMPDAVNEGQYLSTLLECRTQMSYSPNWFLWPAQGRLVLVRGLYAAHRGITASMAKLTMAQLERLGLDWPMMVN